MAVDTVALAILIAVLVFVLLFLYLSIRVVQQYERMVIFRLGRTDPKLVRDPGLRFLIPIIDRPYKVDIREKFIEIPSQTTITKDNAPINIDFLIYWYIVDPLRSIVNVRTSPALFRASPRRRCARSSATSCSMTCFPSATRSTR